MGKGCYAEAGPLAIMWKALSRARPGRSFAFGRGSGKALTWSQFCKAIAGLPEGTLWRHNQAGDLPGIGDAIDGKALAELVAANAGRRGFTYTHKPPTKANAKAIANANRQGFTVNLSADNLAEADSLAELQIGPVVTILPAAVDRHVYYTPAGRHVAVCPATYRDEISCASCQLCQHPCRVAIVGFPAHGPGKGKINGA